jgi:hypothetical protein
MRANRLSFSEFTIEISDGSNIASCTVKPGAMQIQETCIHRRDAMDAEIIVFLFAVDPAHYRGTVRAAKRNYLN